MRLAATIAAVLTLLPVVSGVKRPEVTHSSSAVAALVVLALSRLGVPATNGHETKVGQALSPKV
jgi:hypothetical protein